MKEKDKTKKSEDQIKQPERKKKAPFISRDNLDAQAHQAHKILSKSSLTEKDKEIISNLPQTSNINSLGPDGHSLLDKAIRHGYTDIVEQLIAKGADVNAPTDGTKETPLMKAIERQSPTIIALLLGANALVNLADSKGDTALIKAVKANDLRAVKELIKYHADVNLANKDGNTPIMLAKDPQVAHELLENEVKLKNVNGKGEDAVTAAKNTHDDQIAHEIQTALNKEEKLASDPNADVQEKDKKEEKEKEKDKTASNEKPSKQKSKTVDDWLFDHVKEKVVETTVKKVVNTPSNKIMETAKTLAKIKGRGAA